MVKVSNAKSTNKAFLDTNWITKHANSNNRIKTGHPQWKDLPIRVKILAAVVTEGPYARATICLPQSR